MSKLAALWWREILAGLALLFAMASQADVDLRDVNYILIHDSRGPEQSRLLIFEDDASTFAERVLSGTDDQAMLDAVTMLLTDPDPAVREEAIQQVMDHPDGNVELAAAIGQTDPSVRVRRATAELLNDLRWINESGPTPLGNQP